MLGRPIAVMPLAELVRDEPDPRIIAALGEYALTGQDITGRADRAIYPDAGSYILTGQDVEFPISFSASSYYRILLVGSTSTRIRFFRMAQNFVMTAGDTKTLVVTIRNAAGDVVNITGSSVKWKAARSYGKAAVLSKSTSDDISLSDPTNGIFTVSLAPEDTEDLKGIYHHEAEITDADGAISTVLTGTMKINPALNLAT